MAAGMSDIALTFDDTLVFSTMADDGTHRPRSVTVVFFAAAAPIPRDLGDRLKEHFQRVAEAEELWLVAPETLSSSLPAIVASRDLLDRLGRATALSCVRTIVFGVDGDWRELASTRDSDLSVAHTHSSVRTAGLRALFTSCGALMSAHAGLHFEKPSGKHSARFLRAGVVAERSVHAYFVASALLPVAQVHGAPRIWVDTAAIASVAYALSELRHNLANVPLAVVDSFGGYDGLDQHRFTAPGIALISASTSGGLSRKLAESGVPLDRQRMLFYVGEPPANDSVLCDMTFRSGDDDVMLIRPFPTYDDAESCALCINGQNAIKLLGDSFEPRPGQVTPMTLTGGLIDEEHKAFIRAFRGTRVISCNASDDGHEPTVRATTIRIDNLVKLSRARAEVKRRLEHFLPFRTRYIIHLDDPDSIAIARIAKELCRGRGLTDVQVIPAGKLGRQQSLNDGVAVVIAGVVASGRALLNVSRQLRLLTSDGGDIAYFVGCLKPAGGGVWRSTRSSLTYKSLPAGGHANYAFEHVWYLESEPHTDHNQPWRTERRVLEELEEWLRETDSNGPARPAVAQRLNALSKPMAARSAFLASDFGAASPTVQLSLNPNFAFWDAATPRMEEATHAEVYFTVSTVLHRSRHSRDGKYSMFEQPGYGHVLSPGN